MYTVVKFSKVLNQSDRFCDTVGWCCSNRCTQPVRGKVILMRGVTIWRTDPGHREVVKSWRDNNVRA